MSDKVYSDPRTEVYRELFFDKETNTEYLVHGSVIDGFSVYLNGKQIDAREEFRILKLTVSKSDLWEREMERRERAVERKYQELLNSPNPYYARRAREGGIAYARALHSSQILSD